MGLLPKIDERCTKCGASFRRLLCLALMSDAGAHVSGPGAEICSDGEDHQWPEEAELAASAEGGEPE